MKTKFNGILTLLLAFVVQISFAQEKGLDQKIDEAFQPVADAFFDAIFFTVYKGDTFTIPFVLVLLVGSALFFTIYFGFPNIRYFGKAVNVVRGKYDHVDHGVSEAMYGA